jgi:hypothetical protein
MRQLLSLIESRKYAKDYLEAIAGFRAVDRQPGMRAGAANTGPEYDQYCHRANPGGCGDANV